MRRPALTGVAAATLLLLAACGGGNTADAGTGTPAVADAEGAVSYPLELPSHFGSADLEAAPERIVALTSGDLATLLAVGVVPYAAALYDGDPDDPQPEWIDDASADLGSEPEVYFDMSSGDVPFEAIAATDPDLIVAVDDWAMEANYERLSTIAPVATMNVEDPFNDATWQQKVVHVGEVLDVASRGVEAVAEREDHLAALAADHPEWAGKTMTYAVAHPETLDQYLIPGENPTELIETLGFVPSAGSQAATYENSAISLENLSQLDADIVLVSYPWADETTWQQDVEASPLFQALPAVQEGRYFAPGGDVPSNLAYPDAMSLEWTLDQLVPYFEEAFPA